jgi:hypothetical protein
MKSCNARFVTSNSFGMLTCTTNKQKKNTAIINIIILHGHCKERPLLQDINTFLGLRRAQVWGGH